MIQLNCPIHDFPIIFVQSTKEKLNSRLICQNCEKINQGCPCDNIQKFNQIILEEQKLIQNEKQNILKEFESFSNPLHKLLDNFVLEINSTIKIIHQELSKIQNDIHEYYKLIINYDPQQISLTDLEKISNFIYSPREQYNLKSKYFQFVKVIQILINLQNHYCQMIKKCFEQLQNDLANYEHLYNFNISASKVCNAIAIKQNNDEYLVALALENSLQTYEYQSNKKDFNLKQTLKHHKHNIACTIFSDDKNYLISGGGTYDKKMNIYKESNIKNMYDLIVQVIHQDSINSIISTPNNEDLISASGNYIFLIPYNQITQISINNNTQNQIKKINIKDHLQEYSLDLAHNNTVYQLSYFFIENLKQFLSCSFDKQVLIWQKPNDSWLIINKIKLQHSVYRCCIISENEIVIQENLTKELTFYDKISKENQYQKSQIKKFQFEDLNYDQSFNFPIVFIQSQKLLVIKHNKKIVFLKLRKNGRFYKENEKDGEMGAISPDGQIFLKFNKNQSNLEIYQLNSKFQINKQEFEKKYLTTQLNLYQNNGNQKQIDQKNLDQIKQNNVDQQQSNIQKSQILEKNDKNKNQKDIQEKNNDNIEQNQTDIKQNNDKKKFNDENLYQLIQFQD